MMDDLHLTLLRQMAAWARRTDQDVGLGVNVLEALLDEIDLLRSGLQASTRQIVEMQALETIDIPSVLEVEYDEVAPESQDGPVCPICGASGFKDARDLGGHIWGKHHIRASEMKAKE